MKLNLGSGVKKFHGFLNVDSDEKSNPDYLVKLGKENLPFEDNIVDEVIAHHILEHLAGDDFFQFIKELYRVCKNSAIIDVVVPHPRHDYFFGDLTHYRVITIENMKQLSKKYCDNSSFINTSWSGYANVLNVDFEIFHYEYEFDETFKQIYADVEFDKIDWLARSMNNAITEIKFKMMVIKDEQST